MAEPRIGSLFSGYGGLDMAAKSVFGGSLAWYADCCKFDKDGNAGHHEPHRAPCSIMAHHHPDVPNLGDVTRVDWSTVEPVDILTGGSPCQDLSHAGKRAGMTEGTRSNLWVAMREAIAQLRPSIVVWENVRGAYSAEADSDLVTDARLLAGVRRRDGEPVLRALGRVLGDLSDLGYVGGWHGLRAAEVGAPHGRFRVFVVAERRATTHSGSARLGQYGRGAPPQEARSHESHQPDGHGALLPTPRATDGTKGGPNQRGTSGDLMLPSAVALLPTPTTQDGSNNGGPSQYDRNSLPLNALVNLLPTPAVNDMGEGKTVERWDEWTADMQAKHGNGNGHGKSLAIEAQRLLPTPTTEPTTGNGHARNLGAETRLLNTPSVADALGGHETRGGARSDEPLLNGQAKAMHGSAWGDYAVAIARWEQVLGRPAPAPTQTSAKGNPQLSAPFVEWMMGLPTGWVTDVPGITRNEALKALGNGVVPQQAEAAIRWLLARVAVAA